MFSSVLPPLPKTIIPAAGFIFWRPLCGGTHYNLRVWSVRMIIGCPRAERILAVFVRLLVCFIFMLLNVFCAVVLLPAGYGIIIIGRATLVGDVVVVVLQFTIRLCGISAALSLCVVYLMEASSGLTIALFYSMVWCCHFQE